MTTALHDDELSIDLPLVRALVDRAELLVRLPRQPGGSVTIEKEARWLSEIRPLVPVAVPEVVAVGEPDLGYPERGSIVRRLHGDLPSAIGPRMPVDAARACLAHDFADFITALRAIAVPPEAMGDPALRWYRGEPLATRDAQTRRGIAACRTIPGLDLDLDAALGVWEEAMALPEVNQAVSPRWYHGDLLAENLLVRDGHVAAVLDFGGLGVGDPTIDLIAAWEVLDPAAREVLRTALDLDDVSWLRGRALGAHDRRHDLSLLLAHNAGTMRQPTRDGQFSARRRLPNETRATLNGAPKFTITPTRPAPTRASDRRRTPARADA